MRFSDTLEKMIGRVRAIRPNADNSVIAGFLNDRMRSIIDRRPVWAGLFERGILSIPNQYVTGTISVTAGSNVVTGSGTNWPVSDAVNTTLVDSVKFPGNAVIALASSAGVTLDSLLYVGGGTINAEVVPVVDVLPGNKIQAIFSSKHDSGETVTMSSLAGRQFRISVLNPVWTVQAVTSTTQMLLDNQYGAASQSGLSYQILLMYTSFAPNLKSIMNVIDPVQGISLEIHVPQQYANEFDPNRTNTNSPMWIIDLGPNPNGSMLYEVYPPQTTAYQLSWVGYQQWPDMRFPGDRPPPFINPSTLVHGAMADVLRLKIPIPNLSGARGEAMVDPYFNPDAANIYEARFEKGYGDAVDADNHLAQTALSWDFRRAVGFGFGANWEQSHDISSIMQNY
jgi:hypothetical protein